MRPAPVRDFTQCKMGVCYLCFRRNYQSHLQVPSSPRKMLETLRYEVIWRMAWAVIGSLRMISRNVINNLLLQLRIFQNIYQTGRNILTLYFSKSEVKKHLSLFKSWRSGDAAIIFRNSDLFTGEWTNFIHLSLKLRRKISQRPSFKNLGQSQDRYR